MAEFAQKVRQSKAATISSGTNFDVTFDSPVLDGNTVVVFAWQLTTTGAATITDTFSNTYTAHGSSPQNSGSSNPRAWMWYCYNVKGGSSFQVQVDMPADVDGGVFAVELQDIDTTRLPAESNNFEGSGNATYTSGNTYMDSEGIIIGGLAINEFSSLVLTGGGYNLLEDERIYPSGSLVSKYDLSPSGGAYTATGTNESSQIWTTLEFGFYAKLAKPEHKLILMPGVRKRTKQPPPGTPIDRNNPLSEKLAIAFLPDNGTVTDTELDLNLGVVTNTVFTHSPGLFGRSYGPFTDGTADGGIAWDLQGRFTGYGSALIIWELLTHTVAADRTYFGRKRIGGGFDGWLYVWSRTSGGGQQSVLLDDGTNSITLNITDLRNDAGTPLNKRMISGHRWNGSDNAAFRNGVRVASDTTVTGTPTDTGFNIGLGVSHTGSVTAPPPIRIYGALIWERPLSDAEMKLLGENPWQVFEPEPVPMLVKPDKRLVTFR